MEVKDYIQIFSVAALIIGWFINGYLNRRNEIANKRLEIVLPTLKSFLQIWNMVQDANLNKKDLNVGEYTKLLLEVREGFYLYGRKEEIELFERFLHYGIGKHIDAEKGPAVLEKLYVLVRKRIRSELYIN